MKMYFFFYYNNYYKQYEDREKFLETFNNLEDKYKDVCSKCDDSINKKYNNSVDLRPTSTLENTQKIINEIVFYFIFRMIINKNFMIKLIILNKVYMINGINLIEVLIMFKKVIMMILMMILIDYKKYILFYNRK